MSDIVVGIDLGTSNSVITVSLEGEPIVIPDPDGNRIHPSIIHFRNDGSTVTGARARQFRVEDPEHTVFSAKRLIGRPYDDPDVKVLMGAFPFEIVQADDGSPRFHIYDQLHPPEGISGRVIYYLKGLAEEYLGESVEKAVITVPANFGEAQRRSTKRAADLAGLDVLRLVNEPTAAALAYGYGNNRREKVAIYDFGGGTFDITILELRDNVFQVLSTAGDSYLGGDDFDNRLVAAMFNAFEKQHGYDLSGEIQVRQRLRAKAEEIKHKLSERPEVTVQVTEYVPGSLTELDLEFSIDRDAFNRRCEDIVDQSIATCEDAMQVAGLRNHDIDHLVLVGGSTRIPLVQKKVKDFFGMNPVVDINPDEVVSIGAAIFGASLVREDDAPAQQAWAEMPNAAASSGSGPQVDADFSDDDSWIDSLEQNQREQAKNQGPVLIDVTPHALGVATVGGVMDIIIERNGALPLERSRYFSTSRDEQTRVVLPIFAGNSRRIEDNKQLGTIELNGIPPGPREDVKIEVSFGVDTDGMLDVRATDLRSGKEQFVRLSIMGDSDVEDYDADDLLM